jgi:glutamine synthetase
MANSPDQDFVLKTVRERGIHFIRFWFTDVLGTLKSFAVTPVELDSTFSEGVGFDGSSIEGFSDIQESDMLAFPDASTFQVLPWRPSDNGVARMFCDVRNPDGTEYEGDPRAALHRMVDKASDMGFAMNVGVEMEYFYFKDSGSVEPIDEGGYFDLMPLDNARDLRRDTVLTLEKMGIPVEYSHHETAPSQQEIDLRYGDVTSMADAVMTFRLVAKEIAVQQGVHASFMPKPIAGVSGSGMHIHQSLFDAEGNNVFFDAEDPDGLNLSALAKHYIAGILHYAPEYAMLTNQNVNSYKRLASGFDAPRFTTWSMRDRSTMVRIPMYKPGKETATRIEVRLADPAANPYLAFAAMLGAGLAGIEQELELQQPISAVEVDRMTEEELALAGIRRLPRNLGEAIEVFEKSEFMRDVLGEHIHQFYVENKRREWEDYCGQVSQWELDRYLPTL